MAPQACAFTHFSPEIVLVFGDDGLIPHNFFSRIPKWQCLRLPIFSNKCLLSTVRLLNRSAWIFFLLPLDDTTTTDRNSKQ